MNKSRFPTNSYIGSLELRTVSDFIENDFHRILSGLVSPGLLIRKLSGGQLDTPFKVYISGGRTDQADIVRVTPGLFISNSGGIARIFELKSTDIHIDTKPVGTYNVCVIPNISGYEEGFVTLTNNSDIVTISGGTFAHLRPFASIIVYPPDKSAPSGSFKVIEISGNQAKLSTPFPGETLTNARWKAGARFPENTEPPGDDAKVMFEYNTCEARLSTTGEGIVLGTVSISIDGSGIKRASIGSDRRGESLAVFNNNAANADDVRTGAANSITTIDEKAQAARVYNIVSDYFTTGVRSGGALTITNNILTVAPFIAYDSFGRRLESNTPRTFTLTFTVSGKYPLYAYYGGPGIVNFTWSSQDLINPGVIVGYVTFTKGIETDNNTTPDTFSATTSDIPRNSLKAGSLISSGRRTPATTDLDNTLWTEGEIYYNSADSLFYYVKKLSNGKLQAEKVISKTYLDQQIGALKYLERLRFTLYPFEETNNWFLFNGIGAPAPVGYEFVVVQWKIGVLDNRIITAENSKIDYMGNLQTNPKVSGNTNNNCNWTPVLTRTKKSTNEDLSSIKYPVNSAIGVYFHGYPGSDTNFKRLIELKVNNSTVDTVNMEADGAVADSGGGSPLYKLYSVEVTIQLVSGVQYAIPQQEEEAF